MTTNWGPGFDAEIGYRMERARVDFARRHRGRIPADARNPRPRQRSTNGIVASS